MCIYIATGRQIFKKRAELRTFSKAADQELVNPFTAVDFIKVETEMKVETSWKEASIDRDSLPESPSRNSFSSTKELSEPPDTLAIPSSAPVIVMPRHDRGPRIEYKATAFSTNRIQTPTAKHSHSFSNNRETPNKRRATAMEGNAAAWGYFKVAFLMFAALFIVWVPSTVNRLQQFIDKENKIFGLNLASALVLPLQGFWNSMIYISTTWPECKRALADTLDAFSNRRPARRRHTWKMKLTRDANTKGAQEYNVPISLGTVKGRPESQRHLQSMSSAESVRPVAACSEV